MVEVEGATVAEAMVAIPTVAAVAGATAEVEYIPRPAMVVAEDIRRQAAAVRTVAAADRHTAADPPMVGAAADMGDKLPGFSCWCK